MQHPIHILTQNDLRAITTRAGRLRAFCPVHGSDHQRSLSIALDGDLAGWGFCHSCKATVLLADYNESAARRLGWRGDVQTVERKAAPPRVATWQRDELAALAGHYPKMRQALTQEKPRAYLAARAIPFETAAASGVGYMPALSESQLSAHPALRTIPQKWYDRLIFPYTSYAGDTGYAGRSLALWQLGMDEDEHKRLLEESKIERYRKTYRGGFFPTASLESRERVTLVEGPFDALALLAAGAPDIVALVGTSIELAAIPSHIRTVTLAFDGDESGELAAQKLAAELRRQGIPATICTAPRDGLGKDWNERYRRGGAAALSDLLAHIAAAESEQRRLDLERAALMIARALNELGAGIDTAAIKVERAGTYSLEQAAREQERQEREQEQQAIRDANRAKRERAHKANGAGA